MWIIQKPALRLWRERFNRRRDELRRLGFDEVLAAYGELYLAHAEAGFRSGHLGAWTRHPNYFGDAAVWWGCG